MRSLTLLKFSVRSGRFCVTEIAASWDCFGNAIASMIGYFEVAQETVCKICPPKQSHSAIRDNIDPVSHAHPQNDQKGIEKVW